MRPFPMGPTLVDSGFVRYMRPHAVTCAPQSFLGFLGLFRVKCKSGANGRVPIVCAAPGAALGAQRLYMERNINAEEWLI